MTLRLFLMRHGKSDWSGFSSDHDRRLNQRGMAAAQLMGETLRQAGQLPDQILSSTATRALTTAELFCQGAELPLTIHTSELLYESTVNIVLKVIRQLESEPLETRPFGSGQSLMLVGHEPVWSDLSSLLIGGGALEFPTAAIAQIDLEISDWSTLCRGAGQLKWLLQPKFFQTRSKTDSI